MGHYLKLKLFHEAKLIIYNIIYYYFDNSLNLKYVRSLQYGMKLHNTCTTYITFWKQNVFLKKIHKFCESIVIWTIKQKTAKTKSSHLYGMGSITKHESRPNISIENVHQLGKNLSWVLTLFIFSEMFYHWLS